MPRGWRFGGEQEILWVGENIDCSVFSDSPTTCAKDADCYGNALCFDGFCHNALAADIADGRVIFGPTHWGITPSFIAQYTASGLRDAMVLAGACYSHYNATMARAFLGAGATTYMGYSGLVSDGFAAEVGGRLAQGVIGDLAKFGNAICYATEQSVVPGLPDSVVRTSGSSALSLDLSGLLNAGFEEQELLGWKQQGDTRQISSFCDTQPSDGKFMALMTTGMGQSNEGARLSQRFCLPSDAQTMTISWRYLSSELEETCGLTGVQDTWTASIRAVDGEQELTIRDCTVNDMCHYEAAFCLPKPCNPGSSCTCGDCYQPYEAVTGCVFDGTSVKGTEIIQETVNISSFAGIGAVALEFSVDDMSKQVYDTAVVIDAIKVQ